MIYLVSGPDGALKDQKIAELKAKAGLSKEALLFDYDNLDVDEINIQTLQKVFHSIAVTHSKRFIILHNVHKLNIEGKETLLQFLGQLQQGNQRDCDVILESVEAVSNNSFLKKLAGYGKDIVIPENKQQNVFDVTNALSARDPAAACKILDDLSNQGVHPLQIMGGLVWSWGRLKSKMPTEDFCAGLAVLGEADLNIKRSRLKAQQALELLVVKLSSLMKGR